jgi:polyhydroxyalkanoate synthesis regulator phasin
MSVEQHQEELLSNYNSSQDPSVQGAAQTANQYTELFKTGQINRDEYIALMDDIARTNNINKNMGNMEIMERMNVAINGLINLATLV